MSNEDTFTKIVNLPAGVGTTVLSARNDKTRKIYSIIASDKSGAANYINIEIIKEGAEAGKTFRINIGANDNEYFRGTVESPVITLKPGYNLNATANGAADLLIDFVEQ